MTAPESRRRVLVVADSLCFHGPQRPEMLDHPRLFPNVMAEALDATVDVVARRGWTAREAWWALTEDPRVWSFALRHADAVVLAVGGMDYLPTVLPTFLREGMLYLRPPQLRRAVRTSYGKALPHLARLSRGRLRSLPQHLTDQYLSQCVNGIRTFRPDAAIVGIIPPPHSAPLYGRVTDGHPAAVSAALAWGGREGVPMADLPSVVGPNLARGLANPDGMHYGWESHGAIGVLLAETIRSCPQWT